MTPHRVPTGIVLAGLLVSAALARPADPRGWSEGQMAAGAARILGGPDRAALPELEFPKDFQKRMGPKTLVFYYSPTCPHCQAVGPEIAALGEALSGQVTVIGVASGSSAQEDVDGFTRTYGIGFPMVIDTDRGVQNAMGVRSTPSVVLVEPSKGGKHRIVDLWYPYQGGFDTYVKMRVLPDPWKAFDGTYLGNGSCAGCHPQELESWALTHHSVAWRTLAKRGEDKNPECVGCHVTGAASITKATPAGWTSTDQTPDLVDVGCEACHGPSGPHDGARTDPRTACVGCHDAKHSIQFSVEKGLPLIDHYAANALDDDAFTARRVALLDGEAPRALLAFGDDPTVGAAACKGCHEAEHAQWTASRHGHALQTLRDAEKESDVTCVRCHATAKRGGPPPAALDGFRDEGVGCEACHGPGTAHIAAGGGTENIEKLGEDCPVCVIEAVCTSCHTPDRDADWDLATHLPRAGHGTPAPSPAP